MAPSILYAVVSDIHGNFQALESVEADARAVKRRIDADELRFISLGDVVDYGPQPNECMKWVCENANVVVLGNHDKDVAAMLRKPPKTIDPAFWPITLWTRQVLKRTYKKVMCEWQATCRGPERLENFTLLHSTLTTMGDHGYIASAEDARENLELLGRYDTAYGLFGHTHYQGYFQEDLGNTLVYLTCPDDVALKPTNGWISIPLREDKWEMLPRWNQTLFNPGSVGQPRRHALLRGAGMEPDYRASYMLLLANGTILFQFRRVEYDVDETIRLLREKVRWGEGVADDTYHDIFKDENDMDPQTKKLYQVVNDMPRLLPELVQSTLIPQLHC